MHVGLYAAHSATFTLLVLTRYCYHVIKCDQVCKAGILMPGASQIFNDGGWYLRLRHGSVSPSQLAPLSPHQNGKCNFKTWICLELQNFIIIKSLFQF